MERWFGFDQRWGQEHAFAAARFLFLSTKKGIVLNRASFEIHNRKLSTICGKNTIVRESGQYHLKSICFLSI